MTAIDTDRLALADRLERIMKLTRALTSVEGACATVIASALAARILRDLRIIQV